MASEIKGFRLVDNSDEIREKLGENIGIALEQCGIRAEELAAGMCPVDTGLLRNSITYALDGEAPKKQEYRADTGGKAGAYRGQVPKERDGARSVTIGSNVEYAPIVELGSSKRKGKHFLRKAIQDHKDDYIEIFKRNMGEIP